MRGTKDRIRLRKLPAAFYRNAGGNEPVQQWLRALNPDDRKAVGADIATVEFGWPVGMPVCRPIGDGLLEVRSSISDGRTARVLFCILKDEMVLLHAFIKKTQRTPPHDRSLAIKRKKEIDNAQQARRIKLR